MLARVDDAVARMLTQSYKFGLPARAKQWDAANLPTNPVATTAP